MKIILIVASFLAYTSFAVLVPILGPYFVSLHATPFQIGLLVGLFSWAAVVTMIPFGAISDKVGRRLMLFIGLIIFAGAPLFYLIITDINILMAVRVLHGLAMATYIPAANAYMIDMSEPKKRGAAIGVLNAAMQMGFVVGPTMGGFIMGNYGMYSTFYATIGIALIGLILVIIPMLTYRAAPIAKVAPVSASISEEKKYSFWNKISIGAFFAPLVSTWGAGAVTAFMAIFAIRQGVPPVQIGLMLSILYAGSALWRIPAGMLSDRYGPVWVIIAGFVCCIIGLATISISVGFVILTLTSFIFGTGMGLTNPSSFALATIVTPVTKRGAAMGFTNTFLQAGMALGSTVMGFVAGYLLLAQMWQVAAIIVAIGSIISTILIWGARHLK